MWLSHSFAKNPPDKFSTEVAAGRDDGTYDLTVKGYDTVKLTLTDSQLKNIAATIAAKVGGSDSPF